MKPQFCLFAFVWLVIFGLLMMLGSCTETIYDEVIKVDTVFVDAPRSIATSVIVTHDTVVIRDTVEVRVIVHDTIIKNIHTTDTIIKVVTKDSIIIKEIEKLVTVYDTVFLTNLDTVYVTDTVEIRVVQIEQRVIYLDTFYVATIIRPVNNIPDDLMPYVQEFYQLAGPSANGGPMILQYVHPEDLAGENWSSDSFWFGGQWSQMVIELDESLPREQHRASIFRELARLQLKRKYVTDVNKIMCPLFDPYRTITQSDLNVLFNPLPI